MSAQNSIGQALRSARVARDMSLSDVARLAGVSVATLSRIETGKQSVDVALFVRVAASIGVDPGSLLNGHGSPIKDCARALASCTPAELMQIFVRAGKQSRKRDGGESVHAQLDGLIAAVDLMIEEVSELRKRTRKV